MNYKGIFILNPLVLYFIGTFIGLLPFMVDSRYLAMYHEFCFTNEILIVYAVGLFFFALGYASVRLNFKQRSTVIRILSVKDLNFVILMLLLISFIIFVKILTIYGSVPIISIILNEENINNFNELQTNSQNGGIFGIFFLLTFSLIILFPYTYINKNRSKIKKMIFILQLIFIVIYCAFSGKRQMMFIFFTYSFSYLLLYYNFIGDNRTLQRIFNLSLVSFIILSILFIGIGLIRTQSFNNLEISLFDPVIHYATLPYMNLSNIIIYQSQNNFAYTFDAFIETTFSDLPILIKNLLVDSRISLDNIPIIEITSPLTFYGELFWNFGYIGIIINAYIIGFIVGYVYLKSIYGNNLIYLSLYGLLVWPLLSIHTYNHFKNFMFLLIPLGMILISHIIYLNLPRIKNEKFNKKNIIA